MATYSPASFSQPESTSLANPSTTHTQFDESKLKRTINVWYLVNGYSRRCCPTPSRLSEITMNLIFGFLPKMNGNVRPTFEWNIKPTLSSPVLPSFDSNTFDVGLPNVFFLRLQSPSAGTSSSSVSTSNPNRYHYDTRMSLHPQPPNHLDLPPASNATNPVTGVPMNYVGREHLWFGHGNPSHGGRAASSNQSANPSMSTFILMLKSFPLPPSMQSFVVHFEIYCEEIDCHFSAIWDLNHQQRGQQYMPQPVPNMNRNVYGATMDSISGYKSNAQLLSVPWALPSPNIGHLLSQVGLSFECRVRVLYVQTTQSMVSNVLTPHRAYSYRTSCRYDDKGTEEPVRFVWNITGSQLQKLRLDMNGMLCIPMNALQINSTVFGGMFQLKLWRSQPPNGLNRQIDPYISSSVNNLSTSMREGLSLMITLCGIPKGTAKMSVKFEISVRDHSKGADVLMMSEILTFSFEAAVFPLTVRQNAILQQMASDSKGLTLICRAIIIQKVDEWNNLVPLNKANADGDLNDEVDGNDESERKQDERAVTANKKEMVGVKREFVVMEKEEFLWKITKWESVERLKALNLDDQYLSAPFILFGLKWYVSIQSGNSSTGLAGWKTGDGDLAKKALGASHSNNFCDTLAVHLNPLMPSMTSFDCRVSLRILQTGRHCCYYGRFPMTHNPGDLHRHQTRIITQSIAELAAVREIDILVSMEKVNDEDTMRAPWVESEFAGSGRLAPEVESWLSDTVKLPKYGALFAKHGVDTMDVVRATKDETLRKMGICKEGDIIRLSEAIKLL